MMRAKYKSRVRSFTDPERKTMEVWRDYSAFLHLRCTCDTFLKKEWCNHLVAWMTNDFLDAETLGPTPAVIIFNQPRLIVPCTVLGDKDTYAVGAVWGAAFKQAGSSLDVGGTYNVGYIKRGAHGRCTLRKMILDWLIAIPYQFQTKMICMQSTHVEGTCVFDTEIDTSSMTPAEVNRAVMLDAYQLLDSQSCRACAQAADIDFDIF